jgi:hypothetical protein
MALGPTQPPIQWERGALSLGVKRPGREADHSPPSSAEVKEWVELYIQSPNTPSWRGAYLKSTGTTLPFFYHFVTDLVCGVFRMQCCVFFCCSEHIIGPLLGNFLELVLSIQDSFRKLFPNYILNPFSSYLHPLKFLHANI